MKKMKDSGIEWVGQIPACWNVKKLKHCFEIVSGATPKSGSDSYWDGEIVWITPADYTTEMKYVSAGRKNITKEGFDSCSTVMVPAGSLIFSKRAPIGLIAVNTVDLCTNQGCLGCIPHSGVSSEYYYYVISCATEYFNLLGSGTTFREITADSFANCKIPFPSVDVQERIVEYLREKCAEIDTLIASIEKNNIQLNKLRQSVIYEAVTKGLNPDVPMKNSGVEWIGQIPVTWSTLRLRFLGKFQNGISKAGDLFGSGYPFVSYSDVYKNEIIPTVPSGLVQSTDAERALYSVEKGDIFFTRTSETKEEIGITAVCTETIPDATFAGFLIRMRPTTEMVSTDYLRYYFSCGLQREYFAKEMTLVTRASLGQDLLKNMVVTIPPKDEQANIVQFLSKQTEMIDQLLCQNQLAINKLKEYRQSVIYEAVTGKIEIG